MLAAEVVEATRYVQQYRYEVTHLDTIAPDAPAGADGEQWLAVSFDPTAINALVRDAGLPLWGQNRTLTLIWLAVDDQGERQLLGEGRWPAVQLALERQGERRGLPIVLPLLDLQDRGALTFIDVWGNFRDILLAASKRYDARAVLVGRMSRGAGGDWVTHWTLYHGEQALEWTARGNETAVVENGIDVAADTLAAVYAQLYTPGGHGLVRVFVDGVGTLADYARTADYLSRVDQVEDAQLTRLAPNLAVFRLVYGGDRQHLAETLALDGPLVPVQSEAVDTDPEASPGGEDGGAALHFRLRR